MNAPRRVVIYKGDDGWWWKAQGGNWRTVEIAKRPRARLTTAEADVRKRWPRVEIVVNA